MSTHDFSADKRPAVKYIENDDLAYVILRYRQVHDFWHTLTGLPPTLLGEIALKYFEWRVTGLPTCGLSTLIGPVSLTWRERRMLLESYVPWALRSATECEDLMLFPYEKKLEMDIEDVRAELNLEPAPNVEAKL